MKMFKPAILLIALISIVSSCDAKIKNAKKETFKVWGNCGTCKKTIDSAVKKGDEASGNWDVDSKLITITYDSTKTTADVILKRIADAGYDNEKYTGNTEAYNHLHACCQYDRKK